MTEEFCVWIVYGPPKREHLSLLVHFIQIEEEDPSSKRCHKNSSFLLFDTKGSLGDGKSSRQTPSAEEFSHRRPICLVGHEEGEERTVRYGGTQNMGSQEICKGTAATPRLSGNQ